MHLVASQIHDQVIDAGANQRDDRCLRNGVLMDGRALAQAGIENGQPDAGQLKAQLGAAAS